MLARSYQAVCTLWILFSLPCGRQMAYVHCHCNRFLSRNWFLPKTITSRTVIDYSKGGQKWPSNSNCYYFVIVIGTALLHPLLPSTTTAKIRYMSYHYRQYTGSDCLFWTKLRGLPGRTVDVIENIFIWNGSYDILESPRNYYVGWTIFTQLQFPQTHHAQWARRCLKGAHKIWIYRPMWHEIYNNFTY